MTKDLQKDEFIEDTNSIIANTLTNLAEGITGIAAAKRENIALSVGHIFQGIRGGQFLSTFQKEWNQFRGNGRIKEDYQYSEQSYSCLHELLDFLETDIPDKVRFNLLKQIFLVAATEQLSDRESILPQQYIKICRHLTTGEILVLNATYDIFKENAWKEKAHFSAHQWLELIKDRSGLAYRELVETHEQGLIDKKLLSDRQHGDRSGVAIKPNFRLTELGLDICEYIKSYEEPA